MVKLETNNQTKFRISEKPLLNILNKARKFLKIKKIQYISLAFVPPATIKKLNKAYRRKDRVTDVLSFEEKGIVELGEIIICPAQAKKQSAAFGNSFEKEIVRLLLHGYLHLLGYDHVNLQDAKKMEKIEREIFKIDIY
ncbi:MAG: rRNA maturation RNase YbeY [Parcubacteria group bacterium]